MPNAIAGRLRNGASMTSQPPPSGPPTEPPYGPPSGPPSGPLAGPPSGGGTSGPSSVPPPPSGPPGDSGPPSGGGNGSSGSGGRPHRPWWRSPKGLALAAGTLVVAVVATVVIVGNQGSKTEAIPAANEVALQAPADPGPAPFTPSVETQGMTAPAPATSAAQQPGGTTHPGGATSAGSTSAALHSVEGSSAGLYGGAMGKSSCDTERLIGMVSTGDTGRAWAAGAGIAQADIPGYLRSLTPAYLRVDTRVTNHSYKGGASVEYQSALQAGTAVLVDAQGVPRVRCACGNPLGPPKLMSNAKYTGKAWTGFQPSSLIVVVPAPQPVTAIVLVNIDTGGWFARATGQIRIVDKPVEPPKGPLAPGVPPPAVWKPTTPSGSPASGTASGATTSGATTSGATTSGATTSGSTTSGSTTSGATTSGATTSGSTTSGSTTSSGGPSSSSATTSTGTPSATKSTASTAPSTATTTATTATTAGKPTTTVTSAATTVTTSAKSTAAACATTAPSTLPPCPTTQAATPS